MRDLFAATYTSPINQGLSVYHLRKSVACWGFDRIITLSIFDMVIISKRSEEEEEEEEEEDDTCITVVKDQTDHHHQ